MRAAAPAGNSRSVVSGQSGPHAELGRVVRRHFGPPFRRPVGAAAQVAYGTFRACWDGVRPLVFDSGCGVGDSTRRLAERYADAFVVGIDKSEDRLGRVRPEPLPANALLVRADLVDFWRLAATEGLRLARHYLLYPNPWPKIGQLKRRWHGHPVLPDLLALSAGGGSLELRSNWATYVEEFALALDIAAAAGGPAFRQRTVEILPEAELADPLTPFERKYAASGQTLWRLRAAT